MADENYLWQQALADEQVQLGLNDAGRAALSEISYVELPTLQQQVQAGDPLVTVEASKQVQELLAPVAGTVVAIHQEVANDPSLLATSDSKDNWLVTLQK